MKRPAKIALIVVSLYWLAVGLFAFIVIKRRPLYGRAERQLPLISQAARGYCSLRVEWPRAIEEIMADDFLGAHLRASQFPGVDPWGHPLLYVLFDTNRGFGVIANTNLNLYMCFFSNDDVWTNAEVLKFIQSEKRGKSEPRQAISKSE